MHFRRVVGACLGLVCGFVVASGVQAQLSIYDIFYRTAPDDAPLYGEQLLESTPPDECYFGIGVDYPPINPDGTCDSGIPKRNRSHIWGMTQAGLGESGFSGDDVWFGTMANGKCVATGYLANPSPQETVSWVCEYGESALARRDTNPLPPHVGDWRAPKAYSFDLETGRLTDRTPDDSLFDATLGIRSAASLREIVFLAGPSLTGGSSHFFAWNAQSGDYLGSCVTEKIINIRNWLVRDNSLYAGIGTPDGAGAIAKWTGTPESPFAGADDKCGLEIIATLPTFPAYLSGVGKDRIAVSTWVQLAEPIADSATVGVYLSPRILRNGYFADSDFTAWTKVWEVGDYEPDPVTASAYDIGALTFWNGYLWFGTMHSTATSYLNHTCEETYCYGEPASEDEQLDLYMSVHRSASIWRARVLGSKVFQVELLYGASSLPALVPGTKTFQLVATGFFPTYGQAGFDNPFNLYTWTVVATDRLFFGTYDDRYVFDVDLGLVGDEEPSASRGYGADLWRFDDLSSPAQPESVRGIGNYLNYGVRSALAIDGGPDLLIGTANPMNLESKGGWELIRLSPSQ